MAQDTEKHIKRELSKMQSVCVESILKTSTNLKVPRKGEKQSTIHNVPAPTRTDKVNGPRKFPQGFPYVIMS